MAFETYDLTLLAIFVLFVIIFLYLRRDNLKREGLLILYRTSWGIKLINYTGKKFQKTLKVLSYFSITLGYILMVSMIYLFGKIIWIYAFKPDIVQAIKIPPITPIIPYIDRVVDIGLPSFYFIYWILILAVIAITHEFSHGIFAAYNKIKIKTTGFGFFPFFLPIFLAAFVELDEKKMAKKSIFSQLAILSAGTFANVLTAVLFVFVLMAFFSFAFAPAGVVYDTYSYSGIKIQDISSVNGIPVQFPSYEKIFELANKEGFNKLQADNKTYLITKDSLEKQKNSEFIVAYDDSPAINSNLDAVILEINGKKMTSVERFREELSKYSPGETVKIKTKGNEIREIEVTLGENPLNKSLAFLGVGFFGKDQGSTAGKILSSFSSFKQSNIYYESSYGELGFFIYNLLWWLVLISFSVALVNMLPMGIFDGGRFFYLTALLVTKNENLSKKIFSFASFLLFFLILLVMFFWIFSF